MKIIFFTIVIILFSSQISAQEKQSFWKVGAEYYMPYSHDNGAYNSKGFGVRGEREFGHSRKFAFTAALGYSRLNGYNKFDNTRIVFDMLSLEASERFYILPTKAFVKIGLGITNHGTLGSLGTGIKYKAVELSLDIRHVTRPFKVWNFSLHPNTEFSHFNLSYQF
jgi:hypothetical protein